MQIVLARLDEGQVIAKHGRIDLGERHKFKKVDVPVSCMWINDGNEDDAKKAESYAQANGYTVFRYNGESDPLERARRDIAKTAA